MRIAARARRTDWDRRGSGEDGDVVLEAHGITVRYDGLTALDHIDLQMRRGEILGLIGPNGAGKSTLVNVLSGFQSPDEGRLVVSGRDITDHAVHQVARLGVVRTFQSVRLFSRLTVRQNLVAAGVGSGQSVRDSERAASTIANQWGLAHLEDEPVGRLTHGQERLLAIGRAVATRPRILLLDEPAAGLHDGESADLVVRIRGLVNDAGLSVMLIEHDMKVIMSACARVHVIDHGRTIAEGTPAEIQSNTDVIDAYLGRGRDAQGH